MRKFPTRKLLTAVVAGALFLPETAFTLGLGEIEVNSALNQKLKADIELLSASPEDAETIIVKLASRKEFSRAGLDRPYLLNDLRFKPELIDGVPHIIVSSGSPIREPFLNFLVEIDWPNGHLLREYTVLLDPPVFMTQPASAATAPANQNNSANSDSRPASNTSGTSGGANIVPIVTPSVTSSPRPESSGVAPAANNTTFVPAPPVSYGQQQTSTNLPPGSYRIKTGDTTWSLANAMMPDQSISVEQMMIAMLRENPESFINGNINGLKRGYILRVPDYEQIVAINPADARALVREQAALWRQYQLANAGGQPASAMPAGGGAGADDGAVVTGEEDEAYLEIVSAGSGASSASAKDPTDMTSQELRAELALARERVETERVEKEALQQQVNSLEQNVDKMKGMLSIEDNELSDVQALGASAEAEATEVEPTQGEMLEADIVEDAAAEMAESSAETDDLLAEQTFEDLIAEEAEGAEVEVEESEDAEAVFTDEATDDELAEAVEDVEFAQEVDVAVDDVITPPQMAPAPPADPLSKLLSDPMLLAAAGGGLLLVLAVIGLIIKRRKAAAEAESFELSAFDDVDDFVTEVTDKADDVAAQQTDTDDKTEAENSVDDFDSEATMALDAEEDTAVTEEDSNTTASDDKSRDDVIAEADVYLAYGIYQQAEDLLTQAIVDNPERNDYRVKLAETHYANKNGEAFVEVATEIKKRVSDELTPEWKKIMEMGQNLCGDDPLFQGSMVGGLAVDSLETKEPEMDFDLGLDGTGDTSSELDSNTENQPLDLPEMDDDEETALDSASELEFDISDAEATEKVSSSEDEFSLDIDASELDIDTQDEAALTKESDDVHDLDFGLDEVTSDDSTEEAAVEEEIAIDLTDAADALGLDLDDDSVTVETPASDDGLAEDDSFDLSSLADVDEVSTKLDLARAYLDMGDNEGTRGILEEVIAEGDDEQKKEANELMEKLG